MRRWRCQVCGYVHEGESPPEVCPVCGAPKDRFEEIGSAESTKKEPEEKDGGSIFPLFLLHPISVHFPNALIPTSFLFLVLALLLDLPSFEKAAFYTLIVAAASLPVAFLTGIYNWRTRYNGAWTTPFLIKIISSAVLLPLTAVVAAWRLHDSGAAINHPGRYLLLNLAMVCLVTALGHIGGGIVFRYKVR